MTLIVKSSCRCPTSFDSNKNRTRTCSIHSFYSCSDASNGSLLLIALPFDFLLLDFFLSRELVLKMRRIKEAESVEKRSWFACALLLFLWSWMASCVATDGAHVLYIMLSMKWDKKYDAETTEKELENSRGQGSTRGHVCSLSPLSWNLVFLLDNIFVIL